jgi:capsular exopolysaccharide synthesis family protein
MDSLKEPFHDETFDIREILFKLSGYWYIFVACIAFSLAIAYFVNYFSVPIYDVRTSILVQDEKKILDERFSSGLGMHTASSRLASEMAILKTRTIAQRTIQRLNFKIAYYSSGKFQNKELYKDSPIQIVIDTTTILPLYSSVEIKVLTKETFSVKIISKSAALYNFNENKITSYNQLNIDTIGHIFNPFRKDGLSFTLIPQRTSDIGLFVGEKYCFVAQDNNSLVGQFRRYSVTDNKNASILTIAIQGDNVQKMVDFLNTLTTVYLEKGLEKKNQMAENTVRFIDSQLGDVGDSLFYSEKTLQNYRVSQNVMDVDMQVQKNFSSIENLKEKRSELIVNSRYFNYLKQYLETNNDIKDLALPSAINIKDIVLNNLMNDLINLYTERSELTFNSKKDNPFLLSNEQKIKNIKESLLKTISNLINANDISLQEVDGQLSEMSEKVNKLPETQRRLIGYERKFKLNDALYTYLLTKRSEVQIAKSSYMSDNEVIDEANAQDAVPISPNRRKNYIIAFILGFGLPASFVLLKSYFNFKILSNEDIESCTKYSILGHVIHNKEKSYTVVSDYPMSLTSESIRAIRTNMQFLASEKEKHIILVTSSIMNEGKSFTSLNLALSLALYNKKTVLINFDLRKPKIQEYLGIESEKGLSLFLAGNAELEEITCQTRFENLDAIMAGVIPPNPMELIAGERTKLLFDELKTKYDYIVIDSPPLGMVADAMLLIKYSDINIYVVRYNHTYKRVLSQVTANLKKRGIFNLNIVLNDVRVKNSRRSYSYYSYNYGYGYGYQSGENPTNGKKSG